MTEAVLATFADCKFIRTRSTMQLVLELPIEQADEALKVLGGVPQPGTERWVGVALAPKERKSILDSPEHKAEQASRNEAFKTSVEAIEKQHRPFQSLKLSQQAGVRCNDQQFQDYIWAMSDAQVEIEETATTLCKKYLGVTSRSELDTNDLAGAKWKKLEADYQAHLTDLRYAGSPGL